MQDRFQTRCTATGIGRVGWLLLVCGTLLGFSPAYGAGPAATCAAAKLRAAGKKAAAKLKCVAKAAGKSVPVAGLCLSRAETKFAAVFAKVDAKGGCLT